MVEAEARAGWVVGARLDAMLTPLMLPGLGPGPHRERDGPRCERVT